VTDAEASGGKLEPARPGVCKRELVLRKGLEGRQGCSVYLLMKPKMTDYRGKACRSVRSLAQHVTGRIIVADDDHVACTLYLCTSDPLRVSPDELCIVAAGIQVGSIDDSTIVGRSFPLPRGCGIGHPVVPGSPHEEVFSMLLFPCT